MPTCSCAHAKDFGSVGVNRRQENRFCMPSQKHKSSMGELAKTGKLTPWFFEDMAYLKHIENLPKIKSNLDDKPPLTFVHLHINYKKLQQEEIRMVEVEQENAVMLEKMSYAYRTPPSLDNMVSKFNAYLLSVVKSIGRKRNQKIFIRQAGENQWQFRRLLAARTNYSNKKFLLQWRQNKQHMANLSQYPVTFGPLAEPDHTPKKIPDKRFRKSFRPPSYDRPSFKRKLRRPVPTQDSEMTVLSNLIRSKFIPRTPPIVASRSMVKGQSNVSSNDARAREMAAYKKEEKALMARLGDTKVVSVSTMIRTKLTPKKPYKPLGSPPMVRRTTDSTVSSGKDENSRIPLSRKGTYHSKLGRKKVTFTLEHKKNKNEGKELVKGGGNRAKTHKEKELQTDTPQTKDKCGTNYVKDSVKAKTGLKDGDKGKTGLMDVDKGKTGLKDGDEGKTGLMDVDKGKIGLKDGEKGKTGLKDSDKGKTELKDGDKVKIGLKDGDKGKTGLKGGDKGKTGLKDGDRENTGLKDGDKGKTGLKDGDQGKIGLKDGDKGMTGLMAGGTEKTGMLSIQPTNKRMSIFQFDDDSAVSFERKSDSEDDDEGKNYSTNDDEKNRKSDSEDDDEGKNYSTNDDEKNRKSDSEDDDQGANYSTDDDEKNSESEEDTKTASRSTDGAETGTNTEGGSEED